MGVEITDEQWKRALNRFIAHHGLIQFKVIHRLHWSKQNSVDVNIVSMHQHHWLMCSGAAQSYHPTGKVFSDLFKNIAKAYQGSRVRPNFSMVRLKKI